MSKKKFAKNNFLSPTAIAGKIAAVSLKRSPKYNSFDTEAVALLCKTRTEESPYFIMRRAAQSVKIYHSTVTDTLKKL